MSPLELRQTGKHGTIVIGRHKDCTLALPVEAETVSRRHAEFVFQNGQWHIADLQSRWGTLVNGVRLQANRPVPLGEGDLVQIQPWTFRFSRERVSSTAAMSIDDRNQTMIRSHLGEPTAALQQDMLHLLLEGTSAIHAAADESELMTIILDLARRGTGLENATLIRPMDADGRIDTLMGGAGSGRAGSGQSQFSRSLLNAASKGAVAEFAMGAEVNPSHSILQSNTSMALCAPLMLGATVAAYLYLDSRGGSDRRPGFHRPNAAGFCQALCRMGGLALANLKRIDIERRAAHMEAELTAAAAAQRWILPRAPVSIGPFHCVGKSQAGGYLGGDFFDALVMPDGRLAVSLGDVSGHGAAASVLMTAAQGFLHASLLAHGDLARSVTALNSFLHSRCSGETFITLWTGIFDPQRQSLDYVDAGHGYAMLIKHNQEIQYLDEKGGVPLCADSGYRYETATAALASGDRALIFSDGIVEQLCNEPQPDGQREQFGKERIHQAVRECEESDLLARLFGALSSFAGDKPFTDDVTGVLVRCA